MSAEEFAEIRRRSEMQLMGAIREVAGHLEKCFECEEIAASPTERVDHLVTCPVLLAQDVMKLLAVVSPEWRVFDKDDEKTHPPKKGHYWAVWRDAQFGTLQSLEPHWWHENTLNWSNVTHWQEVIAPVPPQEVKE